MLDADSGIDASNPFGHKSLPAAVFVLDMPRTTAARI
jgi:hypothetical protein